jgi:hypothetical protein
MMRALQAAEKLNQMMRALQAAEKLNQEAL